MIRDIAWWDAILRLAGSVVLGGLPGLDREEQGKDAGMRTHMLLSLGSALFALASIGAFDNDELRDAPGNVNVDLSRIASYVAAGVGFVGAGTILRGEGGVRGLTTATSLWVAAAVGLSAGLGYWVGAVAAAVLGVIVLRMPSFPRHRVDDDA
jgi:putative Mg2+ transporter-C (MgtC) family protein